MPFKSVVFTSILFCSSVSLALPDVGASVSDDNTHPTVPSSQAEALSCRDIVQKNILPRLFEAQSDPIEGQYPFGFRSPRYYSLADLLSRQTEEEYISFANPYEFAAFQDAQLAALVFVYDYYTKSAGTHEPVAAAATSNSRDIERPLLGPHLHSSPGVCEDLLGQAYTYYLGILEKQRHKRGKKSARLLRRLGMGKSHPKTQETFAQYLVRGVLSPEFKRAGPAIPSPTEHYDPSVHFRVRATTNTVDARDKGLIVLPRFRDRIGHAQVIYLQDNYLTKIPDSLGHFGELIHLDLSRNRLNALPSSIGQLRSLRTLLVSHNCLAELPAEIGGRGIAVLDLSHNRLCSLPDELAELDNRFLALNLAGNPTLRVSQDVSEWLDGILWQDGRGKPDVEIREDEGGRFNQGEEEA